MKTITGPRVSFTSLPLAFLWPYLAVQTLPNATELSARATAKPHPRPSMSLLLNEG